MKTIKFEREAGMTLLEVLLAIVIFAVGMLALVHLQGNLARSSGDANARTVATNIAEEIIEDALSFVQVASDPDGLLDTYADITDKTYSFNYKDGEGEDVGLVFTVELSVQDYYFDTDRQSLLTEAPDGRVDAYSDFKHLVVDVSWATAQTFMVDEDTTAEMGTGSIRLAKMIPSIPGLASALIVAEDDGARGGPPIEFTPGPSPDIMKITLHSDEDGARFKEASMPLPDVIREGETVETWMDVVTYNLSSETGDSTFVRREEFVAVSCECTLRVPSTGEEGGLRPTIWTGTEYLDGEFESKVYGESASSQQSAYCDQCCRDHHDGADSSPRNSYDPSRNKTYWGSGSALEGDHEHWGYNNQGVMVLAENDGDKYLEACRMVRVNGWFRVAQDFPMKDLFGFPEGYLEFSDGAATYSGYIADAVEDWYVDKPAELMAVPPAFPATSKATATDLPTLLGSNDQQLQARSLYIDYLSPEAEAIVECMYLGGSGEACEAPLAKSWLEVYPFFETQVTFLARWNETPTNIPIDITNQPVASDNLHDRGRAVWDKVGTGHSTGVPSMHRGNVGFTATEAIDDRYLLDLDDDYDLWILANNDITPMPEGKKKVFGTISSGVGGVKAAQVAIEAANAQCSRDDIGYACIVDLSSGDGKLKVSGYEKAGKSLYACSAVLAIQEQTVGIGGYTVFVLPAGGAADADIVIQETPCTPTP